MPREKLPPEKKRKKKLQVPILEEEDKAFSHAADGEALPVATWARLYLREIAGLDPPRRLRALVLDRGPNAKKRPRPG